MPDNGCHPFCGSVSDGANHVLHGLPTSVHIEGGGADRSWLLCHSRASPIRPFRPMDGERGRIFVICAWRVCRVDLEWGRLILGRVGRGWSWIWTVVWFRIVLVLDAKISKTPGNNSPAEDLRRNFVPPKPSWTAFYPRCSTLALTPAAAEPPDRTRRAHRHRSCSRGVVKYIGQQANLIHPP